MNRRLPAVVALAVMWALAGCSTDPAGVPTPLDAPATPAADALPALRDLAEVHAEPIVSTPSPDWVLASEQGVWVANAGEGLVRYDDGGQVTASVPMNGDVVLGMESGFGHLWAADTGDQGRAQFVGVDLDDPSSVQRVPAGDGVPNVESSIAVESGRVWMLVDRGGNGHGLVSLDPVTTTVTTVRTFDLTDVDAGALRGGFGSLWLTSSTTRELLRLDPADGRTVSRVRVGSHPRFLAAGADAVWVMNQGDGTVSRIDPATGDVTATVTASAAPIDGGDIVATPTAVWVRTSAELATAIDPATSQVVARLGTPQGSGSIAVRGSDLWISAHDVQTVWRLPGGAEPS